MTLNYTRDFSHLQNLLGLGELLGHHQVPSQLDAVVGLVGELFRHHLQRPGEIGSGGVTHAPRQFETLLDTRTVSKIFFKFIHESITNALHIENKIVLVKIVIKYPSK